VGIVIFYAVVIAVDGLLHFYLWKRLVHDTMRGRWPRRIGAAAAILLAVLLPATMIASRSGQIGELAWFGFLWLALMFYLFLLLVALEVPRLVVALVRRRNRRTETAVDLAAKPLVTVPAGPAPPLSTPSVGSGEPGVDRRLVLARGAAIFAGLTAASITGYGVKTALGPPQLDRVQIPLAKLPRALDGTRLAVVSDIHLGPLAGSHHVGRIVDLINSVNADIVCVVGDLVDGSVGQLGRFAQPLARIESRQGAYFVTGNHEYYSGFQQWVDEVARLGVRPLRNERVPLGGLDLAGVNDLGGAQFGDPADFGKALGDRDTSRPVVLMAHQPIAAHHAARYGVDLQVSGHTHGGQVAPFNLVVRLQQPVVSGFGRVDGVPVYVTNGAGFWGPPVRVGAPPQVTVIDLRTP
jgi:uncharacterized protein